MPAFVFANGNSGYFGSFTVNGVELPVISWDLNTDATKVEIMNSQSGLYPLPYLTFIRPIFTVNFDRNFSGANPWGSPRNLIAGNQLTNLVLFENQPAQGTLNTATCPCWQFSNGAVLRNSETLAVAGKVVGRVTIQGFVTVTAPQS
jgi:hypothetical protein